MQEEDKKSSKSIDHGKCSVERKVLFVLGKHSDDPVSQNEGKQDEICSLRNLGAEMLLAIVS